MDTLEHLERQVADSISLGEHLAAAEHITSLVKHCIADERAKVEAAGPPAAQTICGYAVIADESAKAAVKPECDDRDALIEHLRIQRDEWERRWNERQAKIKELHNECNRLASKCDKYEQATAAKDRRIAEIEAECERLKESVAPEKKSRIEYQSIVYEACRLLDEKTNPPDCSIDKVAERIMGLRKQLGEAWKDAELLRQQLAEATRPVEDVSWDKLGVELQRHIEQVIRTTATLWLIENVKPLFQRERAARVAAESERDELRAAVEVHGQYVYVTFGDGATWFHVGNHLRSETFCGACLNAFREEKWKVTK